MAKYALRIEDDNLDLIEKLNDGIRPLPEDDMTHFIFETDESKGVPNEIMHEDDMYNDKGYCTIDDLKWLI